jgi:hypothetical protein
MRPVPVPARLGGLAGVPGELVKFSV